MNMLRNMIRSCLKESVRNGIYIALKRQIVTRVNVAEYLLDRSRPASEILSELRPEDQEELNKIKIYHEYMLASGELVPKLLKDNHYLELLCLSHGQRNKYYKFLAKNEFKKENEKEKMKLKAELRLKEIEDRGEEPDHPVNRFISKYHNKSVERLQTHRIFHNMVLKSQEIVFDASFEDTMTRVEVKNLARQLLFCYAFNRTLKDPFQMVLANMNPREMLYNDLLRYTRVGDEKCSYERLEHMPWIVEQRHYLDIYPDKRIIYLSPNSTNYFNQGEYDHNAVHIIGGIVDKTVQLPLTLARARKEKIEHRAFPIDRFIPWKSGDKSLTLNQAMQIVSIARETNGDWKQALEKSIPSRALIDNAGRNQRHLMREKQDRFNLYDDECIH